MLNITYIYFRLIDQSVEVLGMSMVTDTPATFTTKSCMDVVGRDMTRKAIAGLLDQTNLRMKDFQVDTYKGDMPY